MNEIGTRLSTHILTTFMSIDLLSASLAVRQHPVGTSARIKRNDVFVLLFCLIALDNFLIGLCFYLSFRNFVLFFLNEPHAHRTDNNNKKQREGKETKKM